MGEPRSVARVCVLLLPLAVGGCVPSPETGVTARLVDLFPGATIEGSRSPTAAPGGSIGWHFGDDGGQGTRGWQAHGVRDLVVSGGRLRGVSAGATPLLYVEPEQPPEDEDLLHAVEVALRVSGGTELSARFDSGDEFDPAAAGDSLFPWSLSTPLVPGDEVHAYTLRPSRPTHLSRLKRLLLRPTDAEGATFEIESVRVVTRHEHLAAIDSGIGWHGMGDVFHESIVTRTGEAVRFALTLPPRPWLDLSLATIDAGPMTFHVEARAAGGEPVVTRRTVTRPHRWNRVRIPLDALGGREVALTLRLEAEREGRLGFWGTAAVRSATPPPDGRPQGVVVILADTLRSDRVDAFGHFRETAPVVARLAEEGAVARDCVSQATWTKVSVPAIFTSLFPTTHTVVDFSDRLPSGAETMAEVFREAGYATLALTSISFVGQFTNLHQGYEELHESASLQESSRAKTAREYVDRLLPWLDAHRDVPFFVFLHVADPHSPYRAYEPYDTRWGKPGDADRLAEYEEQVRPHIENPLMQRFGMPRRHELEQAGIDPEEYVGYELDAYDGSILAMDVEIGRVLERLRELGLTDDTLVAFVSDHGTEFLDHDAHFHGQSVYGELNRVPLVVWGPGRVPAGVVLEPTVQTIDLMPTLLALAGLEIPERAQGRSLVPLMRAAAAGADQRWPHAAITEKPYIEDGGVRGHTHGSVALISEGWKLIHNQPVTDGVAEYELFDHRADPLNLKNVAADEPERVTQLSELLGRWRERAAAARIDPDDTAQSLSPEELQRLRSLGYLQ